MVNVSDEYKSPDMLVKEKVNQELDQILVFIYKFGAYYNITIEQSLEFIRRRHYYKHYHDASYQIDLSEFFPKTETINLNTFCREGK